MSNKKFSAETLTKLREEVDSRKKVVEHGNGVVAPTSSMAFLKNLSDSLKTGNANSPAINKMKLVEQKAEQKNPTGLKTTGPRQLDDSLSQHLIPSVSEPGRTRQQHQQLDENYEVGDREAAMYRKMQEQTNSLMNRGNVSVDSIVNEFYNTKPQSTQHHTMGNGLMLNEKAINEAIDHKFADYVNESAGPIMEAALKNTIIELYSKERVRKALNEMDLKGMVKEIVIETIKELRERNKK